MPPDTATTDFNPFHTASCVRSPFTLCAHHSPAAVSPCGMAALAAWRRALQMNCPHHSRGKLTQK